MFTGIQRVQVVGHHPVTKLHRGALWYYCREMTSRYQGCDPLVRFMRFPGALTSVPTAEVDKIDAERPQRNPPKKRRV